MPKLLGSLRYLAIVAVFFSGVATVAAFAWGAIKTIKLLIALFRTNGSYETANIGFLEMMDAFLIAAALLIFALGMYELFIGDLELPDWLHIRNLHDLKAKIGGIAILVAVIAFLEQLMRWRNAQESLYFATAIGIISAVLIAYSHFGGED